jgi:hypothetical protein
MNQHRVPRTRPTFATAAVVATLAAVALAGCASKPDIRSDYDRSTDFSQFRTYNYFDKVGTDRPGYNSIITTHFKNAIDAEMTARGFRKSDTPDLLVNFNANVQEKVDVQSTPTATVGVGYYGYRGGMYGGWPMYTNDVSTVRYKYGTVNIDVVDAKRKQLVWESVGEGRLKKETLQNPGPAIAGAVSLLFQQFPVRGPTPAQ